MSKAQERNQEASVYIGNLDDRCTDELVWELMVQAGPVVNVHLPKDRVTQQHQGYGFCEFVSEEDADYAIKIMNMIKLYNKPIRVNKSSTEKKNIDVGANLYVGNLDPDVDEKLLYDTFSAFGQIIQPPRVARDPETGHSKGFAFINFDNFEAADNAIESMNGQYLANKPINVNFALKKDGKGERHGSAAERLLAAQAKKHQAAMPNRLFADVQPSPSQPNGQGGGMVPSGGVAPGYGGGMVPPPMAYPPPGMPSIGHMPPNGAPYYGGAPPPQWGGSH